MTNPIKYTTGSETNALKKGNFYIGTGDVGKGPSDTTGYYNGVSPSSGGYVIYLYKSGAPGNLSYHNAPTDEALISFTNSLAGQSYTGVNQCLVYFASQTDKVCVNRDYEGIVTDGLIYNIDAGFTPSYPKSGNTIYYLSQSGNNGVLTNGPTFNTDGGGCLVFDGSDDFINCGSLSVINGYSNFTFSIAFKSTQNEGFIGLFGEGNGPRYTLELHTGLIRWWVSNSIRDTSQKYNDGNWYVCTITQNNSGDYKCYINGNLVLNVSQEPITLGTQNFAIASWNNLLYTYEGKIGFFMIYNRVLSATEVLQNYNAQKGRFGL
jgi:hypothetical protein